MYYLLPGSGLASRVTLQGTILHCSSGAKPVRSMLLVIALAVGFVERWARPSYLVLEESRRFPSWIGWFGWGLA